MEQRTVLITGATGYLGSHLVRRLCGQPGYRVVGIKRSTSDATRIADCLPRIEIYDVDRLSLKTVFGDHAIDTVVNCATDYGRRGTGVSRILAANLAFPLEVLEHALASGSTLFVNAGTSLPPNVSDYALAKHQFAQWLRRGAERTRAVNLVMEHYFGPAEDPSKFVAYLIDSFLSRKPELNLTAGEQRRDFIYIDDVVEAFARVIDAGRELEPGFHEFPLGTGQPVRLRDLVKLTQELAGGRATRLNFGAVPYRENEVMESSADVTRLGALGWAPRVELEEGLRRSIAVAQQARRVA